MIHLDALVSLMTLWPVPVPLASMGSAFVMDWPGAGVAHEVEYVAWDGLGRETANSAKRGLSFAFPADGDALLGPATVGMRAGGTRLVWIPAEAVPGDLGGIFPPKTDALLWLTGK